MKNRHLLTAALFVVISYVALPAFANDHSSQTEMALKQMIASGSTVSLKDAVIEAESVADTVILEAEIDSDPNVYRIVVIRNDTVQALNIDPNTGKTLSSSPVWFCGIRFDVCPGDDSLKKIKTPLKKTITASDNFLNGEIVHLELEETSGNLLYVIDSSSNGTRLRILIDPENGKSSDKIVIKSVCDSDGGDDCDRNEH